MPLQPDQTLAHYRLVAKIGEGGMGEIWKATDTALGRDVAIKVIAGPLASDADRLARFEREAKVLAALNHPCIAQIYGFHEDGGVRFLAMELVQGEDLLQRLEAGPVSVPEALQIGRRIAQALETAHESGIIHRDLKPANVVLTADGGAKVLDFGLAKIFQPDPVSGSSASISPTMTSGGTQDGMILGTAAYMSPEQARGKPLDRRSDIWSFGCVLYEMLTGRHAFRGETISDTIALILQTEPGWSALPADTPPRLRELLERCLQKDARNRLRDIGDARIDLERLIAGQDSSGAIAMETLPAAAPVRRPGTGWMAGLFLAGLVAGAGAWSLLSRGDAGSDLPLRVSIHAPDGIRPTFPQITPDGRGVLFTGVPVDPAAGSAAPARLFLRWLDESEAKPVPGTEEVGGKELSPDGRWLAYVAPVKEGSTQMRMYKVPLDGSAPPLALADWDDSWTGSMLWMSDERLVVSTSKPVSVYPVATDGSGVGPPVALEIDESVQQLAFYDVLPDGVHVLAESPSWEGGAYHDRVFAVNVDTGATRKLVDPAGNPMWSPTGHLVFSRLESLLAVPFDAGSLEVTGGAVALADGLWTGAGAYGAGFDLSRNGTLVHRPGGREGARQTVVIREKDGSLTQWSEDRLSFVSAVKVSPDGRKLATTVMSPETLVYTVWVSGMDRPGLRMWMTMPGLDCNEPVWHPDSVRLLFNCEGTGSGEGIYIAPLDGSAEPRLLYTEQTDTVDGLLTLESIHPTGQYLLVHSATRGRNTMLRVDLGEGEGPFAAEPLVPGRRRSANASFSPDGRWVSYRSDDAGRNELFVAPFRGDGSLGPSTLVASPSLGADWLATGDPETLELVYVAAPGTAQKVTLRTGSGLSLSDPEPFADLTDLRPPLRSPYLMPDGRIIALQDPAEEGLLAGRIELVLNFSAELSALAD